MPPPLLFVTGFGPFEDVGENPSGRLVEDLCEGSGGSFEALSSVLPVSFRRAPEVLREALGELLPRRPDLLLGLGMHRESGFRAELRARVHLSNPEREDVDGDVAAEGGRGAGQTDFVTPLREAVAGFVSGRPGWCLSEDAGGYVCERVYRALLESGREFDRPALFVHVPRFALTPRAEQREELLALVRALMD